MSCECVGFIQSCILVCVGGWVMCGCGEGVLSRESTPMHTNVCGCVLSRESTPIHML